MISGLLHTRHLAFLTLFSICIHGCLHATQKTSVIQDDNQTCDEMPEKVLQDLCETLSIIGLESEAAREEIENATSKYPVTLNSEILHTTITKFRTLEPFLPIMSEGIDELTGDEFSPATQPLNPIVEGYVQDISLYLFGEENKFSVHACTSCEIKADVKSLKVYAEPQVVEKILNDATYINGKYLLKFILAHELGHYVYERIVEVSERGETDHGFKSLYDISSLVDDEDIQAFTKNGVMGHAEVDGLGIAILKGMGDFEDSIYIDVLTMFKHWIGDSDLTADGTFWRASTMVRLLAVHRLSQNQ